MLALVAARLDEGAIDRLDALVADEDDSDDADRDTLTTIKTDPGNVSLDSTLAEIDKLEAVWAVGLPPGLFADVSPKIVSSWRTRAAVESPSHLRSHSGPTRAALLVGVAVRARAGDHRLAGQPAHLDSPPQAGGPWRRTSAGSGRTGAPLPAARCMHRGRRRAVPEAPPGLDRACGACSLQRIRPRPVGVLACSLTLIFQPCRSVASD